MSVPKSKRGPSSMQFLENAYELEVYTIKMCRKFPKGLMFLITAEICRLASSCHTNVKAANSIYPTNAHEVQMRRKLRIFKGWVKEGKMTLQDVEKSYQSFRGHLRRCNSYKTLKSMDEYYKSVFQGGGI